MSYQAVRMRLTGLVQGVGFRYFAFRAANLMAIVGWVKNLPDGSVEIEAEGERGPLEEFIKEMRVGPHSGSVRGVDVDWIEAKGTYKSFEVRY